MIDNNKYTRFEKYTEYLPSESRWAEISEIKSQTTEIDLRAKSCPVAGIPILCDSEKAWVDGRDNHTIIFGSTGSKKTRLFVMPTINMMIKAGESFIATDPKGELYDRTAGMAKAHGYDVKVLNFREIGKGEFWNPLNYPYKLFHEGEKDKAATLLNDFVTVVTSRQEAGAQDDLFWIEAAKALATGLLLLLMEAGTEEEANPLSLAKMCNYGVRNDLNFLLSKMDADSPCAINLKSVFESAQETLRSVLITLFSNVSIFVAQQDLTAMLSQNTVNVKEFGEKKTAFYLIVPDEKTTTHFLVTAFIKQAYEMLIEQAQKSRNGKLKIRVNFVLDEFCNIPNIPDMPNMISAARSRNIRYFLVAQSMNQLKSRYGEVDAGTIKGNCLNWVFLSTKERELLAEICDLCGKHNEVSGTFSGYVTTDLISTSELQRLDKEKGEVLIIHDRCYPFITRMPDIDDYASFRGYPKVPQKKRKLKAMKALDLRKLAEDCAVGEKPFPFAAPDLKENAALSDGDIKLLLVFRDMLRMGLVRENEDFQRALSPWINMGV